MKDSQNSSLRCRVSFVGFRDIKDTRRFEVMPFTEDIDELRTFVGGVKAEGGDDIPEDT